jgi:hypothetical protein
LYHIPINNAQVIQSGQLMHQMPFNQPSHNNVPSSLKHSPASKECRDHLQPKQNIVPTKSESEPPLPEPPNAKPNQQPDSPVKSQLWTSCDEKPRSFKHKRELVQRKQKSMLRSPLHYPVIPYHDPVFGKLVPILGDGLLKSAKCFKMRETMRNPGMALRIRYRVLTHIMPLRWSDIPPNPRHIIIALGVPPTQVALQQKWIRGSIIPADAVLIQRHTAKFRLLEFHIATFEQAAEPGLESARAVERG